MKLGMSSLSIDGFGDEDFARSFEFAAALRVHYLELNLWYPRNIVSGGVRSLERRLTDTGIGVTSLHMTALGGDDHKEASESLAHKMRGLDIAAELGAEVLCFPAAPAGTRGGITAVATLLEHLLPHAAQVGVSIALENHDRFNVESIEHCRFLLERFNDSRFGICADVGHFHAAGIRAFDVADQLSHRISHIHLKDNASLGVHKFVPFGEGTAANGAFVRRMIEIGYDGAIVIEPSPTSLKLENRDVHLAQLRRAVEEFSVIVGEAAN